MYLNILEKLVRVVAISLLVTGGQAAASADVDIENDSTNLTKLQELKVQLKESEDALEKVLSDVVKNQGDNPPPMDVFRQKILMLSMQKGLFVECRDDGVGRKDSFFTIIDLEFGPYTFIISKRLSSWNSRLWSVADKGMSYYLDKSYGEGGDKTGSVELLKALANLP